MCPYYWNLWAKCTNLQGKGIISQVFCFAAVVTLRVSENSPVIKIMCKRFLPFLVLPLITLPGYRALTLDYCQLLLSYYFPLSSLIGSSFGLHGSFHGILIDTWPILYFYRLSTHFSLRTCGFLFSYHQLSCYHQK